ncbi:MAG: restriction endonuclease subunit S [Fluviicola sp. XM-24bin1]|nr:MAG: restriction endonuclease subunit S [Fluviicola sp. XM-24bin1]
MEKKLPVAWVECEFKELTSFVIGGDWGKDPDGEYENETELVACIRGSEIKNWDKEKGSTSTIRKIKPTSLKKRALKTGDILIEISGGGPDQPVGRTIYIDEEAIAVNSDYEKVCTNFLRLIRFYEPLNSRFIEKYLTSFYLSGEVVKYQGGSNNLRNLKYKEFETITIPLPPLPEQQRIVAKLDSLFAHLEEVKSRLDKVPELLKQFRQSVLTQAVTGKLTEEWRKGKEFESFKAYNQRINQIRQSYYDDSLVNWKSDIAAWKENGEIGKRPVRPVKLKELPEVEKWEYDDYGDLPIEWGWTRFNDVTYKIGDIDHKMPKDFEGGIPYLSTGNLKSSEDIDFENAKTISREDYIALSRKIKPEKDDIIFPRYGTIGRNIYVSFDKEFLVSYSCAIVKNIKNEIDPKFVYYVSLSQLTKKEIQKYVVQTTQANIGISSIEKFLFPLAPIEEQAEIVRRIEGLFSKADAIESIYEQLKTQIDNLPQALLAKAFKGALAEQLPSDGDARELLEEINKLKEETKKKK